MGKRIRSVTFDGADGVGKTSQLNLLAKRLREKEVPLHTTKLLGGDGTCEFQMAMRKVLLSPKFPKNSLELEEQLFAMTCGEATKMAQQFLQDNEKGIVLKDRGIGSHFAYALAKSIPLSTVEQIFRDLVLANKDIARRYGSLDIILLPDNVEWSLARIASRNAKDGVPIVDRLENSEMQKNVVAAMQQIPYFTFAKDLNFEHLIVHEQDTIQDVQAKVDEILSRYDL